MRSIKHLFPAVLLLAAVASLSAQEYSLSSPNGLIQLKMGNREEFTIAVWYQGQELVKPSPIAMTIDRDQVWGKTAKVRKSVKRSFNEEIVPVVQQKRAIVLDHGNELTLYFSNYHIIFRAYDDGVAYRFVADLKGPFKIFAEQMRLNFNADYDVFFPEEADFFSHQERTYQNVRLSSITPQRQCITPALIDAAGRAKILISEADLDDYPGMWLKGSDEPLTLQGVFPHYVLKEEIRNDRNVAPVQRADYLADTHGPRPFPWRVLMIAGKDGDLIESDLIYRLGAPPAIKDTGWIKPGKVAWDWWNANNIFGVDFRAGINTATYKHYIDFASEYGLQYIILDEGWYKLGDLLTANPDIDMPELLNYAKSKGVGVILWMSWKTLYDQLQPALDRFAAWGIPGIKVDFMQRDDQWMVNYYRLIASEAAKRHMLVDFHGAYKPTGLERTFPNVITREGVKGMEHSKWSDDCSPEHDLTLIFTRMATGPMDYTPGAMLNDTRRQFKPVFDLPHSQGTRCHQMAMYVVYESPLMMLADSPSHYRQWPECTRFIAGVPTVWDETRVLDARVGDYVVLARRTGSVWYLAAMTDWTARTIEVPLGFLGKGRYRADIFQDGANADRCAMDYGRREQGVGEDQVLDLILAEGGGWVARIAPAE